MKDLRTAFALVDKCLNHTHLHHTVRNHGNLIVNDVDIMSFCHCYRNDLKEKEKMKLLEYICQKYGPSSSDGTKSVAKYEQLFDLAMRLSDGLQFLVLILNDIFNFKVKSKSLTAFSMNLSRYMRPCFTTGYLHNRRITMESSAEVLDSVRRNEAIHPIVTFHDLQMRFQKNRRCFALFHDGLPQVGRCIL